MTECRAFATGYWMTWYGWSNPDAPQTTNGHGGWSAQTSSYVGRRFDNERAAQAFARTVVGRYQSVKIERPDGTEYPYNEGPRWWEFWL